MKLFSYNPKTKVFEYRLRDALDELHIKSLLAIHEKRCLDTDQADELFAGDFDEDDRWQVKHDIFFHLSELGLIEHKNDQNISDWNGKEYVNSRKVSGYFLTTMGKSFVNSLLPKEKKNKFIYGN